MQPWIKYLIASLMLIFAAGTVMQKAHSVAMTPVIDMDMSNMDMSNGDMSNTLAASTDTGGDIGCAGCSTNTDGSMSCTMGCVAQFAGLLAEMSDNVCRSGTRQVYARYLRSLCDWRSSPDPYPPRISL